MTEDKVQMFKLELKAMPLIKKRIARLTLKLEELEYNLQNVRGVDPARDVRVHGIDARLDMIEAKDEIIAQLDLLTAQLTATQIKLDMFSQTMQKVLVAIYCDNQSTADIAESMGYSESSLRRAINKQIANTLYF